MTTTLETLENELGVVFSETFRRFWKAHVPDKVPRFKVESKVGKAGFADVGPHPEYGWLIEVRNNPDDIAGLEASLAHELLHLVLYKEGYPAMCPSHEEPPDGWNSQEWHQVAGLVHSILTHPMIRQRMRCWGFPVEEQLCKEIKESLQVLAAKCDPEPDDFVYWRLWVLTYMLNWLDEGDQICSYIVDRAPSVAEQGEEHLKWLYSAAYSDPEHLTIRKVIEVGQRFLKLLEIDTYYLLCVTKDDNFVKVPEVGDY